MTFRPERYPADWKAIRARILERAGHCCEQCRVPNREVVFRIDVGDSPVYVTRDDEVFDANNGARRFDDVPLWEALDLAGSPVRIVLTIAHVDHNESNNDDANLLALCQRCHFALDREDNKRRAAQTRAAKRGPMLPGVRS